MSISKKLPEAVFDEVASSLRASLLRSYVDEGEVGSDGEQGDAGEEAADGEGQLLARGRVRPQYHIDASYEKTSSFVFGRGLLQGLEKSMVGLGLATGQGKGPQ
ncbi:hypothetical protein F0562_017113 [Nyssa sinensis]|uniref:Uncharacterized protein n=1 Tax=Nyssa sinensis TaxID=561372 RepID=A0A5J4ZHQ6_9ASTE|nr:hypothetical protein F0562_017113 [Nyssa sinensis]